ncbi:ATP-grasp domain-containing protein [Catellatospora tritici]|uniref:ATP-grasp domain-containing protein n=1 Tax=Catellatospora tritici TaxID=2851566 RepID=UPI001C2DEA05|nr:ATP-grasp domain-containing protein [Catellatospora tritici]MBV1852859.1 ATP-grasp domain-containing protein [Catellatospora tritici]
MNIAVSGADFLVLPPRPDRTAELLAAAAGRRGLAVERLTGPVVPDRLRRSGGGHLYGGPIFTAAVAADLDLALLEPDDDWLTRLPYEYTRRDITLTTLGEARWSRAPMFVKQPRAKDLAAGVYADGSRLPGNDRHPADTPVLVSEIVTFLVEYRLFVLDGAVHAASRYAVSGRLDPASLDACRDRAAVLDFAADLLDACADSLPSAVVVDVGLAADPDRGDEHWAVVEANMAWFSIGYAADPDRVLDVLLRASGPRDRLALRDQAFTRSPSLAA